MKSKFILFARIAVAIILIQTLRFKFTAHPDSVYIFSKVGLEPYGRIFIGILELISGILILIPRTVWMGALLSAGVLIGAVFMHLSILGIEINNDGGVLFYTALITLVMSVSILVYYKKDIPFLKQTTL